MRGNAWVIGAAAAVLAGLAAPPTDAAAADPLAAVKASCQVRQSTDAPPARRAKYRICSGTVASFDGTPLDVTVTLPARRSRRALPLVVFLHGFLNSKGEYLSETREGTGVDRGGDAYKTVRWNNVWFASRGYAVLNYSARGQGDSGGTIDLASKHTEVRDTHHLTGLLADDSRTRGRLTRVHPRRVAVLGGSYGGGQTWLLLTTRGRGARQYGSWVSPGGRGMRLAAAVPQFTWSDLLQSLAPNGRDGNSPFGIGKLSIVNGLVASAGTKVPPNVLGWIARLDAGEPYDSPADPVVPEAKRALLEDRSAFHQGRFFRALRGRRQRSIPVLAAQGWTDPIFPAVESVRMYRALRAARRGYPVALYFGDFEHLTAAAKIPDLAYYHRLGNRMLDRYLRRRGKRPRFDVRSARTRCEKDRFGPVSRARSWRRLGPSALALDLPGSRQTVSPLADPRAVATDPVLASTRNGRGCVTTDLPPTPGVATWTVPLPPAFSLIGMPRLSIRYHALAPDVQLNSRLWDVAPDGTQTLVTRGAYRAVSPNPLGDGAEYDLFGNHWRFEAGHRLMLEVTADDSPYLRRDNFPAVVSIDSARLVLPGTALMRRAPALALAVAALAAPAQAGAAFPATPPNDPMFDASPLPNATNEQWDLASPAAGFDRGISADRAWPLSTGSGVSIADIDVGVDLDHPDLAGRWLANPGEAGTDARGRDRRSNRVDDDRNGYVDDWRGYDFFARDPNVWSDTRNTHGTNVAGVLGAATDNGTGIAGVAPDASILPVRTADNILHQSGRLAEAIVYSADRGAGVMSMSLGTDSNSAALYRAARYATARGSVLVAASGNEFSFHHNLPGALDQTITVGGLNPDTANTTALNGSLALVGTDFKVRAAYSDYGASLDVVAPTQVPTTQYGGGYTLNWSGTSAATPHVAGVAALVLARGKALGLGLRAREVRQIVNGTAGDLADPAKDTRPGWDRLTGYGRVDAFAAVSSVQPGKVPPEVDITAPTPFQPANRDRMAVKGIVRGRSPTRWTLELGEGEEPQSWRTLATGGATGSRGRRMARVDPRGLAAGGYTLRLRATDSNGNRGEDRAFFFSLRDPQLKRGYPRQLGSSGESSPQLADLNGDGRQEIVLATADGRVTVLSGRTGRRLRGWPKAMRSYGTRIARRKLGTLRQGFLGTPAVGNIVGSRRMEIVAAGLDGRVYAWTPRGRRVRGFPVRIDLRRPESDGRRDASIYASPALADLDGNGKLDIVVGAADQKVYAWNGRGRRLPGWPVLARDSTGGDVAKILSSPAVGDLDGDGSPDVVEGTAEAYGSTPTTTGRVYAFSARGKLLPGWPVKPEALSADGIPLAGEGVPMSPSLADVDGDGRDEVAVSAFTGRPELFRGDGSRMSRTGEGNHFQSLGRGRSSPAGAPAALSIGANAAFGRTSRGGPLRLFGGLVDLRLAQAQISPASRVHFEHLLGGWDARSGDWLPAFPRPLEGWTIVSGSVVADVDGDGHAEALAGSSGYRLHAVGESGREPEGWPKQTGGWLIAAPAVGDVDGDGRLEVVAVTREGWLFAWNTPAPKGSLREWPLFRHDRRNSGRR